MVWSKRARTAETPKQPSSDLRLRAPYFYPDQALAPLSLAGSVRVEIVNVIPKPIGLVQKGVVEQLIEFSHGQRAGLVYNR